MQRAVPAADAVARGESSAKGPLAEELELKQDLERVAMGQVRAEFRYQPIVDLKRGLVAGYEALVRLPVRAGLPPDVCLQAAARFGTQVQLESVIATQAFQARHCLPQNVFLSINVSPAFLCSPLWDRTELGTGNLSGLVVEITEGEFIEDYEEIRRRATQIAERGGMIAIDDAGAGYASLKHILELRPSFIKLDRNFVQHCDQDRAKSTMIEVLGAAADRLDAWVIAEGVETSAELAELVRLEVPLAQGYFLGRPEAEMNDVLAGAKLELRRVRKDHDSRQALSFCAEPCPGAMNEGEAETLLSEEVPFAAVVDGWGRPTGLLERHPVCGTRLLPSFLRCHESSDLREALQRALTRQASARFDPIVLTDSEGRLCGAVRMDRLMRAVLDQPE
jgi:EAL domain-containing protein (putative c-di-GMP-specific phosphodiesterase class I)